MYVSLAWQPEPTEVSSAIQNDLESVLGNLGFRNLFTPYTGLILANIPRSKSGRLAGSLETDLRTMAPNRFSFIISLSPRKNEIRHSGDIAAGPLTTLEDY